MQVFRVFATLYLVIKHVSLVFVSSTGECCHAVWTCWGLSAGHCHCFPVLPGRLPGVLAGGGRYSVVLDAGLSGSGTPQKKFPYKSTQLVTLLFLFSYLLNIVAF